LTRIEDVAKLGRFARIIKNTVKILVFFITVNTSLQSI
jgi:hypothetical protein